ncbi:MAG: glycosyltransferase [Phycisphaerales bacterium]|nr:glycosyltransferase [Phycisphaerales bacterium]
MTMEPDHPPHILINALSVSSGGGFTVAREVLHGLATRRPAWTFTLAMTGGSAFHEPMRRESFPANVRFLWAPEGTGRLRSRLVFENFTLVDWCREQKVSAVVQLNGQKPPRLNLPMIAHCQDPVPYLPHVWGRGLPGPAPLRARLGAAMRRRAIRHSLKHAACVGFTSGYLRDLILGWEKVKPARAEVFYNAVPDAWASRDAAAMTSLASRPMEVLTVSDVTPHKRQHLVARAVCALRQERGLESLTYRAVGRVFDERYAESLRQIARDAGTPDAVRIEGRLAGDAVEAAFQRARCFAFMSVCESFGIPPLEALSFGAPVVSSRCCAMPEVLGDAAAFVEPDDEAGLIATLRRVLTDAPHSEELRRRGFERCLRFRWGETCAKMVTSLEEMVSRGR